MSDPNVENIEDRKRMRAAQRVKTFASILVYMRVIRIYQDGDGVGFLWRWWNPISWFLTPLALFVSIVLNGIIDTFQGLDEIGFKLRKPYNTEGNTPPWYTVKEFHECRKKER